MEPSLRINRVEQFMNLVVPMDSFSGQVDLIGQITAVPSAGGKGMVVATVRDVFDAGTGTFQVAFTLLRARVLALMVREQATGMVYSESIPFRCEVRASREHVLWRDVANRAVQATLSISS
jgi:hypothetical protein